MRPHPHIATARRYCSLLLLGSQGLLWTCVVKADVATHKFTVTATIEKGCVLGSTAIADVNTFGTLNFGNSINTLANPIHIASTPNNGSIVVRCTPNMLVSISLNNGNHASGNIGSGRLLKHDSSSATLRYQLYQNPGHTTIWGNDSNGGTALRFTTNGLIQTMTVYAALLATPNLPAAGQYADVVTVTVSY